MSLPVKKIYVESQYRAKAEDNSSNFTIELPYSITMPENAIFTIDEICIPHTWNSIEQNVNDRFYLHAIDKSDQTKTYNIIAQVPSGNYTGTSFTTALFQAFINAYTGSGVVFDFVFTYDSNQNQLNITSNNFLFKILSDHEITYSYPLASRTLGLAFDSSLLASTNPVLQNFAFATKLYGNTSNTFTSGFLNFQTYDNIYLSSPNLGNFTTIGPRGQSTLIKKIPVSSAWGFMIIDRSTSVHDYLECGKQTLKSIEFHLKDSRGAYINMHGANVSFSIVFAHKSED